MARETAGWTGRIDDTELQTEAGEAAGPQVMRSARQRFHDALREGCELSRASCRV